MAATRPRTIGLVTKAGDKSGRERDGGPSDATPAPHGHAPVLVRETLAALAPKSGETVVDCTAGRGGHAVELARAVGPSGRVVLVDVDAGNLAYAAERVRRETGCEPWTIRANFAGLPRALHELAGANGVKADVVLADLGFSSSQMDDPARGFSFAGDGPLDMRLDPTAGVTAADLIRSLPERELAELVFRLGEEPLARAIARKIVDVRRREPIESTAQLARLVREAYGPRARRSRLHPATRTFMALRIAVNDELGALRSLLDAIRAGAESVGAGRESWLRAGARVGVITFHSLEDRLVKHSFAGLSEQGLAMMRTRKPVVSSDDEIAANPRSRSAKLRVVQVAMVGAGAR
ncbi:MAG: 16S rRNA (cytosine(1402)-N(4))-methyltransferase RsmH [Phycisphaerales bacterium]